MTGILHGLARPLAGRIGADMGGPMGLVRWLIFEGPTVRNSA